MKIDLGRVVDAFPDLVWTALPDGGAEFINRRWSEYTGISVEDGVGAGWRSAVHPDDLDRLLQVWGSLVETGKTGEVEARLRRFDGVYRRFMFRANPLRDEHGDIVKWCGTNIDIEDRRQAETQLTAEKRLLEMTASGCPLDEVLDAVCRFVEALSPECICGLYPIDWSGPVFKYGVAPSLPATYIDPIKGWPVAADKAPCGIAVAENRQVIVVDVETDPIWRGTEYRDHVVAHGLRAVWSTLIRSVDGRVLGSFCVYQREPATPAPRHQELIAHATHIAAIALERAQADEALRAREAELRRANAQLAEGQRLSKTGTFTADLQMDQHEWSEEFYRIFEIDPATLPSIGAVRERVHLDDQELFDAEIRAGMEGGDVDFTFRIATSTAGIKYLRGVARVAEHVAGRAILMGTVQDITESKLAEEAQRTQAAELRRAHDYLTEAQRLSKTGSFTWDVLADEHNWSEEIRRIFGFGPDVEINMGMIQAAVHPDDIAEVERVLGGAPEGRVFDLVFRIRTAEGEVRHAHVVGHPIADITDRPVFLGALQDVTESKVAEEALRTGEAELRRANRYLTEAQRMSHSGSFTWDPYQSDMDWSEGLFHILDFDLDETPDIARLAQSVHPDDTVAVQTTLLNAAMSGVDYEMFYRIMTRGGEIKHLHTVGQRLLEIADRNVFIGATQDITERVLGEEALNRARTELAHVSRIAALSALTASIAHEVNQPLAGIVANASTCLRMLAANPPNLDGAQATAQRTIRDANRAAEVIMRLRALFARRPPGSAPVDLNDAAREVLALSSAEVQGARVVAQTDFANDLPTIPGDRVQLQQVILNLVLNAAEAMRTVDDRPRDLSISTVLDDDGHLRLSVRDGGIGADIDHRARLFDAFYTTKPEGMGVGLSISRSIIEAHGGRIWAEANDGPGLTLVFSLPVTSSLPAGAEDDDGQDAAGAAQFQTSRRHDDGQ
jgi:PAS domain S-box-containing protein